jgi:hypothetical protein
MREQHVQVAVSRDAKRHVDFFLRECGCDPAQTTVDGISMVDLASTPDLKALLRSAIVERTVASLVCADLSASSRSNGFGPI